MPGILKKRLPTRADLLTESLLQIAITAHTPRTLDLSRACLEALLKRGVVRTDSEREWVKILIRDLTGFETLFEAMSPSQQDSWKEDFQAVYEAKLSAIANGNAPRKFGAHDREAVRLQWRRLIDEVPWDFIAHSKRYRKQYLLDRWCAFMGNIQQVPCRCTYNTAWLEETPEWSTIDRIASHTKPREFIIEIIAEAHGAGRHLIEALGKTTHSPIL